MKRTIVTMLAASMFVSSAFAGLGDASKSVSTTSKAVTGASTNLIVASQNGTQSVSRAAIDASQALTDLSTGALSAIQGVSVSILNAGGNSTDSKIIKFSMDKLTVSVNVASSVLKAIPEGANFILARTAQGAFILIAKTGDVVIDVLQLDLDEAVKGIILLGPRTIKAMVNSKDETREKLSENRDK